MLLIFNKITIKYCGILFRKEKGSNQAPRMERTQIHSYLNLSNCFQAPRMEQTYVYRRKVQDRHFQAPRMEQTCI